MTDNIPEDAETKFDREVQISKDELLGKDKRSFQAWLDTMKKGIVFLAHKFIDRQEKALWNLESKRRRDLMRTVTSRRKLVKGWVTKWQDKPVKTMLASLHPRSRLLRRRNFYVIARQLRGDEWCLVSGSTMHFSPVG